METDAAPLPKSPAKKPTSDAWIGTYDVEKRSVATDTVELQRLRRNKDMVIEFQYCLGHTDMELEEKKNDDQLKYTEAQLVGKPFDFELPFRERTAVFERVTLYMDIFRALERRQSPQTHSRGHRIEPHTVSSSLASSQRNRNRAPIPRLHSDSDRLLRRDTRGACRGRGGAPDHRRSSSENRLRDGDANGGRVATVGGEAPIARGEGEAEESRRKHRDGGGRGRRVHHDHLQQMRPLLALLCRGALRENHG